MTEEPTVPGWYDKLIEYMAKRERRAAERRELAEPRRLAKEIHHRERSKKRET